MDEIPVKDDSSKARVEYDDFYIENGNYVFKSVYLLKRGFCCESGCRHCPYRLKKKK